MKRISYLKFLKLKYKKATIPAKMFGWMMFKIEDCDEYFLIKTTRFARVLMWIAYLGYAFYLSVGGFFSLFKTNIIVAKEQIDDVREWKVGRND